MLTLIETNDALSLAMSKHSRAVLQARKQYGPSPDPTTNGHLQQQQPTVNATPGNDYAAPQNPPPSRKPVSGTTNGTSGYSTIPENPFNDPSVNVAAPQPTKPVRSTYSLFNSAPRSTPTPPQQINGSNDYSNSSYQPRPAPVPEAPVSPEHGYNASYRPTQSYVQRQDSAVNHFTMHGASPPPSEDSSPATAAAGR